MTSCRVLLCRTGTKREETGEGDLPEDKRQAWVEKVGNVQPP